MKIVSLLVLIASSTYLNLVLRLGVLVGSALLVTQNFPIGILRKILLALRGMSSLMLTLFILAFGQNRILSLVISLIICWGSELQNHLHKRTTAAFSTSDVQNQRMFNLSIVTYLLFTVLALVLDAAGLNPLGNALPYHLQSFWSSWMGRVVYGVGLFWFLKKIWLLIKHFRTFGYLAYSYASSLRQGKLKRYW